MDVSFWAVATPEISSVLHFAPRRESSEPYHLSIRTPIGSEFKSLEISVPGEAALHLELNNILAEILPDNGIRHAQIVVGAVEPGEVSMRLISDSGHQIVQPMSSVNSNSPFFAPKSFMKGQTSLVAVSAPVATPVEAVLRLMAPGRAPEVVVPLNPAQTKIVNLQTDFVDVVDLARKNKVPAYLRVRARGDETISVAMLDQFPTDVGSVFQMVTL